MKPARERLLDAADNLFYGSGIRATGIDSVIAEAEVAKATLYSAFGSKDELAARYLRRRSDEWFETIDATVAQQPEVEPVSVVFGLLAEWITEAGFNGCPCANAAAEQFSEGPVAEAIDDHRRRLHATFVAQLRAGFADATEEEVAEKARGLVMIYDGAITGALLDRANAASLAAQASALAGVLTSG